MDLARKKSSGVADKLSSTKVPRFAYVHLMAGCNPDNPVTYLGFLYNLLVSKYILRQSGSSADVVALVQMSSRTNDTQLLSHHAAMLQALDIHIYYTSKPARDSFYAAQMAKFQVLQLSQYDRILFLDGDVMPLCNLDYLFHLSWEGSIRENLVISWTGEPANGGFFLLKPGNYEELQAILRLQYQHQMYHTNGTFDTEWGWGHVIQEPDEWTDLRFLSGRQWDWYGAYADQGLLYYWVKYHRQSVTLVNGYRLMDWHPGSTREEPQDPTILQNHSCLPPADDQAGRFGHNPPPLPGLWARTRRAPYRDFVHFFGKNKPWEQYGAFHLDNRNVTNPKEHWVSILQRIFEEELEGATFPARFSKHRKKPQAPLGRAPAVEDMMQYLESVITEAI